MGQVCLTERVRTPKSGSAIYSAEHPNEVPADGKVVVASLKPIVALPAAQIVDAGQMLPDNSKDGLIELGAAWAAKLKLKTGTVVRHLDGFRYQVVR